MNLLGAMNATRQVTESLWVLLLDTRNKVLAVPECARGDVGGVSIRPQEVFRAALQVPCWAAGVRTTSWFSSSMGAGARHDRSFSHPNIGLSDAAESAAALRRRRSTEPT